MSKSQNELAWEEEFRKRVKEKEREERKKSQSEVAFVFIAIGAMAFFYLVRNVQILCIGSFILGIAVRSLIIPWLK